MSRRRQTDEATIVTYFTECDPAIALVLFHVVRGLLDARGVFKPATGRKVSTRRARPLDLRHQDTPRDTDTPQ